jgi:hypothetical protein
MNGIASDIDAYSAFCGETKALHKLLPAIKYYQSAPELSIIGSDW